MQNDGARAMSTPRYRLRPAALVLGVATAAAVVLVPAQAPAGAAAGPVPPGFRVVESQAVQPGVEHLVLRRDDPPQQLNVARLSKDARSRVRAVPAGATLAAGPAPTSAACARVGCSLAVNGDFSDPAGRPIGALVSGGELVTSSVAEHTQLQLRPGGRPTIDDFAWSAELRTAEGRALAVDSVNRPVADGITLYTTRWGPSTGTDASSLELVVGVVGATDARPLPPDRSPARLADLRGGGNSAIPAGNVVLSGRGTGVAELAGLWERTVAPAGVQATLTVSTGGAKESVGGSPRMLLGGGPAWPTADPAPFVRSAHPRTMVGATPAGELLIVTVDGRQPGYSNGASLAEAADILSGLGAVEGVNLDGGNSTTFVVGGAVRNRPSDGGERPVSSALVVLPG